MLVVQAAVIALDVSRAGFIFDDFVNYWVARIHHWPTPSYFLHGDYGHLSMGQRLLHYVVLYLGRLRWEGVMVCQVGFGLIISLSAWRMVRLLAGPWWAVAGTAMVAFSPLWADSWLWWSSGIDYFVSLPACFLAFELASRRILGGPRRLSLQVALWMVVAFAFRERPAVLPMSYLLLALALYPDRLGWSRTIRYLASLWDLALASSLVVAAYGALLVVTRSELLTQARNPSLGAAGPGAALRFVGNFLAHVFVPGLVGLVPSVWPWPAATTGAAALLVASAALVVVLLLPRGWRALLFLAGSVLTSVLPVAIGRAGVPGLALQPRYGVEILPMVALTVALLGREWQAGRVRAWVARAAPSPAVANAGRAAGLAALAAVITVGILSCLRFEETWSAGPPGSAARPLIVPARTFRRSLRALATGPGETLLDGLIPPALLLVGPHDQYGAWTMLSGLVSSVRSDVSLGRLPAELVSVIDGGGSIQRYRTGASATVPASALRFAGAGAHPPGAGRFCASGKQVQIVAPAPSAAGAAVLVELVWAVPPARRPAPMWVAPIRIDKNGLQGRGALVPGSSAPLATAAVIAVDPGTAEVGFELPDGSDGCIEGLRVTPVVAAPL
jgi:hypothetical protein